MYMIGSGSFCKYAADGQEPGLRERLQQQAGNISTGDVALGAGGLAAGIGGGLAAAHFGSTPLEKMLHGLAVEKAYGDTKALDIIHMNGQRNKRFMDSAKKVLWDRDRVKGDKTWYNNLDYNRNGQRIGLEKDYKRFENNLFNQEAVNVSRLHDEAARRGLSLGANWTPEQDQLFKKLEARAHSNLTNAENVMSRANKGLDVMKKAIKPAGAVGGGLLAAGLLYNHFKNRNQEPVAQPQQ